MPVSIGNNFDYCNFDYMGAEIKVSFLISFVSLALQGFKGFTNINCLSNSLQLHRILILIVPMSVGVMFSNSVCTFHS